MSVLRRQVLAPSHVRPALTVSLLHSGMLRLDRQGETTLALTQLEVRDLRMFLAADDQEPEPRHD